MGKYQRYNQKTLVKPEIHPIWRGIGCVLIVLVPLMAYGLMLVTTQPIIDTGLVPYQLQGFVHFPLWVYHYQIITSIANFIASFNNMWVSIIVFFVMLLFLTAILSVTYTGLYQTVGPKRYTSLDAPPSKHKGRKYTR